MKDSIEMIEEDWTAFERFIWNREIERAREKDMARSLSELGGNVHPVLVWGEEFDRTGKMWILDGQNRVWGSQFSKTPIKYKFVYISPLTPEEFVDKINQNQKQWTIPQMIRRNAILGKPGYKYYWDLIQEGYKYAVVVAVAGSSAKGVKDSRPLQIDPAARAILEYIGRIDVIYKSIVGQSVAERNLAVALRTIEKARAQKMKILGAHVREIDYESIVKKIKHYIPESGWKNSSPFIAQQLAKALDMGRRTKKYELLPFLYGEK